MRIIRTRLGFVAHLGNATTLPCFDRNSAARAAMALLSVIRKQVAMPVITLVWEQIREPHLYMYRAVVGDRCAEVIRAYPGQWFAYLQRAGHTISMAAGEPRFESKGSAKRRAERFLRGQMRAVHRCKASHCNICGNSELPALLRRQAE